VNRLENRLLDAFSAAADTITPESLPGLHERSRRPSWQRLTAPLAAAAAVIIAAVIVPLILTAHTGTVTSPSPATLYVVIDNNPGVVIPVNMAADTTGRPIPIPCPPYYAAAVAPNGKTAYVVCPTGVVPINTSIGTAGPLIPIRVDDPNEPGFSFENIVITPDGRTAYVLESANPSTLTPINLGTGKVGKSIVLGNVSLDPDTMAITPDGKTIYIVGYMGAVMVISTTTNEVERTINLGTGPTPSIAITPDGETVYVASSNLGKVVPISTATNKAGKPIPVGTGPDQIAITPDGKTAYVVNNNSNTVTPINTATNKAGKPIPVGSGPDQIAITPDGKTAYVTNQSSNNVTPIDTSTNTAGHPIAVGFSPASIIITPNGQTAYVTGPEQETVRPITIATNRARAPITVGNYPEYMMFGSTP
jgi:YVTN family beta-propeller protein